MPHDFFVIFGAYVCTIFSVIFPYFIANWLVTLLTSRIMKKPGQQEFLVNQYMPELHEATRTLDISLFEIASIWWKFSGAIMKVLFASAFQEHHMQLPLLWSTKGLRLGTFMMPIYNGVVDFLSGFE